MGKILLYIRRIASYGLAILLAIILGFKVSDFATAIHSPEDYHFMEINSEWSYKSQKNYLIAGMFSLMLWGGLVFLSIQNIRKRGTIWNTAFYVVLGVLIIVFFFGLYQWAQDGFDH